MFDKVKSVLWRSLVLFIDKDAPSRGAAIAFFIVTSLAPVLIIVVAVAGFVFGEEAARGAIVVQLRGHLGEDAASLLQRAIVSASQGSGGILAMVLSTLTLILISSGVFGELELALNALWDAKLRGTMWSRLLRGRLISMALVLAIGFLLIVSLVVDAAVNAIGMLLGEAFPLGALLLQIGGFLFSFVLTAVLFGTIYRVLPSRYLRWRDVAWGAILTTFLFQIGKFAIGFYLSSAAVGSALGAGGALIGILFWVYYSSMIFLYGAAIMRVMLEDYWDL